MTCETCGADWEAILDWKEGQAKRDAEVAALRAELERTKLARNQADARASRAQAEAERDRLRQAHWDGRAIGGFDNDGDPTPRAVVSDFAALILDDWQEMRARVDEARTETDKVEAALATVTRERDQAREASTIHFSRGPGEAKLMLHEVIRDRDEARRECDAWRDAAFRGTGQITVPAFLDALKASSAERDEARAWANKEAEVRAATARSALQYGAERDAAQAESARLRERVRALEEGLGQALTLIEDPEGKDALEVQALADQILDALHSLLSPPSPGGGAPGKDTT